MLHNSHFGFVSREVSSRNGILLCLEHTQNFLGMDLEQWLRGRRVVRMPRTDDNSSGSQDGKSRQTFNGGEDTGCVLAMSAKPAQGAMLTAVLSVNTESRTSSSGHKSTWVQRFRIWDSQ